MILNFRILVIGATNRPQDIDEAARRRLVKRLYIPLPNAVGREAIILNLLKHNIYSFSKDELAKIVERTDGYSGSDLKALCEVFQIIQIFKQNRMPV